MVGSALYADSFAHPKHVVAQSTVATSTPSMVIAFFLRLRKRKHVENTAAAESSQYCPAPESPITVLEEVVVIFTGTTVATLSVVLAREGVQLEPLAVVEQLTLTCELKPLSGVSVAFTVS